MVIDSAGIVVPTPYGAFSARWPLDIDGDAAGRYRLAFCFKGLGCLRRESEFICSFTGLAVFAGGNGDNALDDGYAIPAADRDSIWGDLSHPRVYSGLFAPEAASVLSP